MASLLVVPSKTAQNLRGHRRVAKNQYVRTPLENFAPLMGKILQPLFDARSDDTDGLWTAFRALVNTRPPIPADPDRLSAQDELLRGVIEESGIRTLNDMPPSPVDSRLRLWRGDITTLAVDAIVNAANSQNETNMIVVFNVFMQKDESIYGDLLA